MNTQAKISYSFNVTSLKLFVFLLAIHLLSATAQFSWGSIITFYLPLIKSQTIIFHPHAQQYTSYTRLLCTLTSDTAPLPNTFKRRDVWEMGRRYAQTHHFVPGLQEACHMQEVGALLMVSQCCIQMEFNWNLGMSQLHGILNLDLGLFPTKHCLKQVHHHCLTV